MKTKAVRLYGKNDLRLEEFELPPLKNDEILARVISDSICMSSYKATVQGEDHKRVPKGIKETPIIIGHEFCGEFVQVGEKWAKHFKVGDKFSIQPALNDPTNIYAAPGYSFPFIGGDATYIVIPEVVMRHDCLLPYKGDAYYFGSLAEPLSCIIGGFHVNYHNTPNHYLHKMGIVPGGKMALLAGAGPMGLGTIDYAIHGAVRPGTLVVTDIDAQRLARAQQLYPINSAADNGVELHYVDTSGLADPTAYLRDLSGGSGFDDVYVLAPVAAVIKQADEILGHDGCLNFFAGPTDPLFSAAFNFYNVHYLATHVVGNSGGNTDDMLEALQLMADKRLDPSAMITHIGGLNAVIETTKNLPQIPGGKKLIYNQIELPLTAIADMAASSDPLFQKLGEMTGKNRGLWNKECEEYLLTHAPAIMKG